MIYRDLRRHLKLATRLALFGEDRADSIWLARIVERGMISASFVPPEPIRRLRTHTRYRRHLTQARTAEKQRVEKLLEEGT
jgi:transposase